MAAIKSNVINPSVEVQFWMFGLKGAEDWLKKGFRQQRSLWASCSNPMGDMEPVAELGVCHHCFGPCVDLHRELQC